MSPIEDVSYLMAALNIVQMQVIFRDAIFVNATKTPKSMKTHPQNFIIRQ